MSYERKRLQELQHKYGLKQLHWERRQTSLDLITNAVMDEGVQYSKYVERLKDKYSLPNGLEFERGYAAARNERTLQEIVNMRQKDGTKGLLVAYGCTNDLAGRLIRLCLEVKPR